MTKANGRCDSKKEEASSPLDETLLDEFFTLVASIALRLTKAQTHGKNGDDSDKEATKP